MACEVVMLLAQAAIRIGVLLSPYYDMLLLQALLVRPHRSIIVMWWFAKLTRWLKWVAQASVKPGMWRCCLWRLEKDK